MDGSTLPRLEEAELEAPPAQDPFPLPDPIGIEMLAVTAIIVDLAQALSVVAPGLVEPSLSIARIRLQMLERGEPEVVGGERMVQGHKIRILERALGRTPTVA